MRRAFLALLVVACTRGKPAVPILGYHSIGALSDEYTVPQGAFEQQLDWLRTDGFETLSIHDLLAGGGRPRRGVILTFDDGKEDAVRVVLPALRRRAMRGTFFVITRFVGQPGYLDWNGVRALAAAGMEIGSHTADHARLSELPDDRVREELVESKRVLERELHQPIEVLAYPYNSLRARTAHLVEEAGYRAALAGVVHGSDQRFSLYRFSVTGATTLDEFRAAATR